MGHGLNLAALGARCAVFNALITLASSPAFALEDAQVANNYYRFSDAELETVCDRMSPTSYASGLTDGAWAAIPFTGRTYFYKSGCYYELARRTGQRAFCSQVKERKTWLGDGSAVSPQSCERTVAQVLAARQAQQASADRHAATLVGAFKIRTGDVQPLPNGDWLLTTHTEGALSGHYRFKVERINTRKLLAAKDMVLTSDGSQSWTITRGELVGSTPLPAIFPIAISLYYQPSAASGFPADKALVHIQNVTLSAQ